MKNCHQHPDYAKYLPRINKTIGQLSGVKKMITDRRYCPEIITQLKAVSSACQSIEALLLEKHLESCVIEAFHSNDKKEQVEKIQELTKLYKK